MADPEAARDGAVAVAYVHAKDVAASWHHCMIELIGWDIGHEQRVMRGGYVAWKTGTDGLADARNKVVKAFLNEHQAEWLFWIDTDMGFAPDTVDRLLAAADPAGAARSGRAVLHAAGRERPTGWAGGGAAPPRPCSTGPPWRTGRWGSRVRWNYPPDTLTRVAGTGAACVLIHRSVFEKIQAEYGTWYDRVPNTTAGHVVSEDLSMCLRAGALDIPIYVHTGREDDAPEDAVARRGRLLRAGRPVARWSRRCPPRRRRPR